MTQRENKSRALYDKRSWTPRFKIARRAVFLMALDKLLCSTAALAKRVSARCPRTRLGNTANSRFGTYGIATQ